MKNWKNKLLDNYKESCRPKMIYLLGKRFKPIRILYYRLTQWDRNQGRYLWGLLQFLSDFKQTEDLLNVGDSISSKFFEGKL